MVRRFVRAKGLVAYEALQQHGLELLEASLPFCFGVLVRCDLVRRWDVDRSAFEDNLEGFAVIHILEFLRDEVINVMNMCLDVALLPIDSILPFKTKILLQKRRFLSVGTCAGQ